jgi:hypothetical protein
LISFLFILQNIVVNNNKYIKLNQAAYNLKLVLKI